MVKQAPSPFRILAMVAFALSCFGILMFLWLAFGGSIPLRPEGYRFQVALPEAATLAQEADVRLAGVNVGKVKSKKLDGRGGRTLVQIELHSKYAPIPKDSRAVLRQKTLLGESYVELAPGHRRAGMLPDGGRLPDSRVEGTVELDEIFSAFDRPTRRAFQEWVAELRRALRGDRARDLNDALGNLPGFATDGATLLRVLDGQRAAVRRLVRDTGVVFGALGERQGALRELIQNADHAFGAIASRDRELAETIHLLPTFLDETRTTLGRLERFSTDTRPLVRDLRRPADDLGPTVRDLGDLSPDLEALFRDLPPVIRSSRRGLPELERVLRGAEPLVERLSPFLDELNPILSFLNFNQPKITNFFTNAAADIRPDFQGEMKQTQIAIIDSRSFQRFKRIPDFARGNAYLAPNALERSVPLQGGQGGGSEAFLCPGGERRDPLDRPPLGHDPLPPCFLAPPSLYNGKVFAAPQKGRAPRVDPPPGTAGTRPATP